MVDYLSTTNDDNLSRHQLTIWNTLERHDWILKLEDGVFDSTPATVMTTLFAGGVSGGVHHAVTHVAQQWRHHARHILTLMPTLCSSLAASGPTSLIFLALIFLAFQFGGEMMERILESPREEESETMTSKCGQNTRYTL